jgi:hypothetical protein
MVLCQPCSKRWKACGRNKPLELENMRKKMSMLNSPICGADDAIIDRVQFACNQVRLCVFGETSRCCKAECLVDWDCELHDLNGKGS